MQQTEDDDGMLKFVFDDVVWEIERDREIVRREKGALRKII